jgi:O-antigen/teichoic acid export membrane protein
MLTRALALPRRLLHGGAAGDAASAHAREIASNVAVQLAARAVMMAISVVTVALTARTLDPEGFGVLSGTSAYVGLFGTFTDLGLTTVAMQRMAADPEREADWLGALATARLVLSVAATVLCGISIPLLLSNAHHGHLVALITTLTILSTGPQAMMAVFQSRLRAGVTLSFSVLQSFLWLGAVVTLAAAHASVVAFAATNVAILVVIGALQVRTTRRYAQIAWQRGRELWRALARVALPLGIASVLITVYYQIDAVLLLQIAGAREAGVYGAAYRFLAPLTFLPAAVMSSFFPVLAAVHGRDPARSRRLVQVCADSMAAISLPILAVTIALSGPIVRLLYGPGFQRTAGLLPILMIAFVSICFGSLAGFLAPVLNLQWRLALFSAIGAAANVALNLLLIPHYGAYGSAWATVITEVLTMVLMLSTALLALGMRISPAKLLRTIAVTALMTGAMVAASGLGLVPAGLLGLVVYGVGLFALRIVDRDEIRALRRPPADLAT